MRTNLAKIFNAVIEEIRKGGLAEVQTIETQAEKPLEVPDLEEISSSRTDVPDLYKEYKIHPYNPDTLVGKKGLKVFDKLRLDDQVKAVLNTKKTARLSTRWKIVPYSNSIQDKEIADFVLWNLKAMDGTLEADLYEILSALDYGFSITEIVWKILEEGKWKGRVGLKALKTRKPHNFDFKTDFFDNLEEIWMTSATEGKKKLPPKKFIVFSYQKEFDNFYGVSDLRAAYRNIFSKDVIIKFWNIWLERFPSPIMLGFYPKGTPKKKRDELLEILKRVQIATAAIIPDDLEIDIRENKSVGHEVFKEATEFHNKSIARAILVPDLIGFTETTGPGSYALGKKHFDIFLLILEKLGLEIEETLLYEQLIKRLVDFNWKVEGYPKFRFETLSEENVEARAKIITMLVSTELIGKDEEWVREYLGLPLPGESYSGKHFSERKEFQKHNFSKCMDCRKTPEIEVLWADGRAHAWFCMKHFKKWAKEENREFVAVKKISDGKASKNMMKDNPNPNIAKSILEDLNLSPSSISGERKSTGAKGFIEQGRKEALRSLTKYEEAAGFNPEKLSDTMDKWLETSAGRISQTVSEIISSVVSQVKSKKILQTTAQDAFRKMQEVIINPRPIRSQVLSSLMYAYFLGKEAALDQVQKSFGKKLKFEETEQEDFKEEDFTKLVPAKMLDEFKKRVPMVVLKRGYSKILQREKNKAFTIAGIIEKDTLSAVQELLIKAVEQGWSIDEFEHQVRERTIEYTGTAYGRARTGEPLTPYHLETILRTNFSDIYNAGKKELYDDPDVVDFVPAFQYSAILDAATRPNHRNMDKRIYPRGDPIWKRWWPPVGYKCRCTVIPVTSNLKYTVSDPPPADVKPDPGFGGLEEERERPRKIPSALEELEEEIAREGFSQKEFL